MALPSFMVNYHRGQLGLLRRHWKITFILWITACAGGVMLAFVRTSTSDAARLAFAQAKTSPIVADRLGLPVHRSPLAFGEVEVHGSAGYASVSFSVYGPHGWGILYADAIRHHGSWQMISLDLILPGQSGQVNLLPIQSTPPR